MLDLKNIILALANDNMPLHRGLSFEELMTHTVEIENEDIYYD